MDLVLLKMEVELLDLMASLAHDGADYCGSLPALSLSLAVLSWF